MSHTGTCYTRSKSKQNHPFPGTLPAQSLSEVTGYKKKGLVEE